MCLNYNIYVEIFTRTNFLREAEVNMIFLGGSQIGLVYEKIGDLGLKNFSLKDGFHPLRGKLI
jgi:hypothetical protein